MGARNGVTTIGLVLNRKGAERALQTPVNELGAVACASDGFGIANQKRTAEETVEDAIEIIRLAHEAGRSAQVTISAAFGCPFDGVVEPARIAALARRLAEAGPREITLGDTIGAATPVQVQRVIECVRAAAGSVPLRCHFHDTRNMAIANAFAALECGIGVFDGSIGGSGGCPFAPGATGNVATEDLVFMLQGAGVQSGIALDDLIQTARWLNLRIARPLSKLARVGTFPSTTRLETPA